ADALHAVLTKLATPIACRHLSASDRGDNHTPTGTAIVRTPPITLRVEGTARGAARTVCSVVPTTELALQSLPLLPKEAESYFFTLTAGHQNSKLDFLAGRIVAPESS